jgi:TetR/AcrR family transcriptional repressor of mexJK operon
MQPVLEVPRDADSPKRQAILDAASDLFVSQGYGAVSMDAIARAASVSKATLYAHFASKDVLFANIIRGACQENVSAGHFLPDAEMDLGQALTDLGGRMLRFLLDGRPLAIYRVVVAESTRFPELGRAFYESGPGLFRTVFAGWLAEQHAVGRIRVDDPMLAADQFISMLRGGLYMRATLGLAVPPWDQEIDAIVASAAAMFVRAYGVG